MPPAAMYSAGGRPNARQRRPRPIKDALIRRYSAGHNKTSGRTHNALGEPAGASNQQFAFRPRKKTNLVCLELDKIRVFNAGARSNSGGRRGGGGDGASGKEPSLSRHQDLCSCKLLSLSGAIKRLHRSDNGPGGWRLVNGMKGLLTPKCGAAARLVRKHTRKEHRGYRGQLKN